MRDVSNHLTHVARYIDTHPALKMEMMIMMMVMMIVMMVEMVVMLVIMVMIKEVTKLPALLRCRPQDRCQCHRG